MMKILVAHPTSNQNSRAVVNGLLHAGLLNEFYTTVAAFPGDTLYKLSAMGPFKEIARRQFESELEPFTKTSPYMEIGRLISSRLGIKSLIKHETGILSVDAIYQNLDKKIANHLKKASKQGLNAIYAYEDGAFHSFKKAKEYGVECLYDLPIGYWRYAKKLLSDEQENWPDWSSTLTGLMDSEFKLERKDQELAMADLIFVASTFTAKSLDEYPGKLAPIKVIPYGFPETIKTREYNMGNRPLKLLFVGGLSQRKGIANMFAAVENLVPHVQLTVVGRKSTDHCVPLNRALLKHKWIPSLPHNQILKLMQAHDVLLFPSLFEGFGLVITEAMSQGTPVITTNRTAGPDLIEHGHNGWLVEAGSTSSLQQCIEGLLSCPEQVREAGEAAIETAKKRSWGVYGQELATAIKEEHSK